MSDNEMIRRGDVLAAAKGFIGAETAIAALPAVSVGVKPLEWGRGGIVDYAKPLPGMKYVACSTQPHGCWVWWLDGDNTTRTVERDEHHAKAAAQADYEARIRAALTTVPAVDVKGLVEALPSEINVRETRTKDDHIAIRNIDLDDEDMGLCLIPRQHVPALIAALAAFEKENGK